MLHCSSCVHEHERIHAHNHHNEVTFSSCSWMNYCTQEREIERMGRAFHRFCHGNSNLSQRLGSVGGFGGRRAASSAFFLFFFLGMHEHLGFSV